MDKIIVLWQIHKRSGVDSRFWNFIWWLFFGTEQKTPRDVNGRRRRNKPTRETAKACGQIKSQIHQILMYYYYITKRANALKWMVEKNTFTISNQVENTLEKAGLKWSRSAIKRRLHESKCREFRTKCKPVKARTGKPDKTLPENIYKSLHSPPKNSLGRWNQD